MIPFLFWIVAAAAAPSVESVLKQMATLAIPDTSDYRSVTSVQIGAVTTRVSMHVIQAGKGSRWMELDAGGRQSRIVTSGGRSLMTDLVTNTSMAIPSMDQQDDQIVAMKRFAASRWAAPRQVEANLWELVQQDVQDSTILSRSLVWDETAKEVRSLDQIGRRGDTTRIEFAWMRSGGHTVPSSTTIVQSLHGQTIRTVTTFSDWRFPGSIPSSLFEIP